MRWAVHVARMKTTRNGYSILVGIPEKKRSLGKPRNIWKGTKIIYEEIGLENVHLINMTENVVNCGLL
jgi:hypothetical protein